MTNNGQHPRVTHQPQCEKCGGFDTITVKTKPMPDDTFVSDDGEPMARKMQLRYRQCRECGHITKCPHVRETVRVTRPRRVTGPWAQKN
jgi:uncharacterized Zn finger protein